MDRVLWQESFLQTVERAGEDGCRAVEYIRAHKTLIGFKRARPAVAAFWTLNKKIYLNSHYYSTETSLNDPMLLSLLVHEARHLQQGFLTALSVYGELDAWQTGFRFYHQLTGNYPNSVITDIMSLPLNWDRQALIRARELMQIYAGKGYRIDLLPLYPLSREIRFLVTGN